VTSGSPSPTLGAGYSVAMAYLPKSIKMNATVSIAVKSGKKELEVSAKVSKMPFVKTNYYSPS